MPVPLSAIDNASPTRWATFDFDWIGSRVITVRNEFKNCYSRFLNDLTDVVLKKIREPKRNEASFSAFAEAAFIIRVDSERLERGIKGECNYTSSVDRRKRVRLYARRNISSSGSDVGVARAPQIHAYGREAAARLRAAGRLLYNRNLGDRHAIIGHQSFYISEM